MSEHELWNELGNLYFLSGSYNQATHAYNKAIRLERNFGEAYSNLALVCAEQARYEDAIQLYTRSLDLLTSDEEKVVAWNRLGNAYRHLQKYQLAVVAYQHADEFRANLDEDNEKPYSIPNAEAKIESREEETFVAVGDQFTSQEQPGSISLAAEQKAESTLPETALDVLEKPTYDHMVMVTQPDPGNEEISSPDSDSAFVGISQLPVDVAITETSYEMDSASIKQAESIFTLPTEDVSAGTVESTDDLEPSEEEIPPLAAEADLHLESDVEMIEVELQPTEPIAQAFVNLETQEEPIADTDNDDSSSQLDPGEARKYAQDAEKEMDPEEVKLAQQIQLNPRSAETWEALGALYKAAGRYEKAILAYKQAISIKPDEVSYHHNLGLVYSAQRNNKDAFIAFQTVLELDPNHSLTHASLGGYYKKMGLDELAQKHIGKAMKKIYESENEYNRACLDAICGNTDQAIELLRTALENDQTNVDWVLHDPDLEVLREDNRFKQLIAEFSV